MEYLFQYWWLPGVAVLTFWLYRLVTKNLAAEKERADLQQHLMKANLEVSKQQVKISELTQQSSEKETTIEGLLRELNADRQSQTEDQKTSDHFRAQIRKLQETLSVVNNELAESKKQVVELQEELKKEQETAALQSNLPFQSLEQFQAKISSLQKIIREQNDSVSLLHQKKNMNEQQIAVLRDEVKKKTDQLHAAEAALQKRELELASSFASKDMSSVALQQSMSELEYSVKILERQLEVEHAAQKNLIEKGKESEEKLQTTIETLKQIIDGQNEELQQLRTRENVEKNLTANINDLQKKLLLLEKELLEEKKKNRSAQPGTEDMEDSFTKMVKTVLYKAPVMAFLLNNKGTILAANEHFGKFFGSLEAALIGKDFGALFSPEERSFIMNQWNAFESKEDYFQGNISITINDGSKLLVYFTLSLIPTAWNEPFYIAYLLEPQEVPAA